MGRKLDDAQRRVRRDECDLPSRNRPLYRWKFVEAAERDALRTYHAGASAVKDELAARRAAKGLLTIKIGGKVMREVKLDACDTIDPLATMKARAPQKPRKPTPRP
jgi:hypothetical protein